jgi:hypothetical protein
MKFWTTDTGFVIPEQSFVDSKGNIIYENKTFERKLFQGQCKKLQIDKRGTYKQKVKAKYGVPLYSQSTKSFEFQENDCACSKSRKSIISTLNLLEKLRERQYDVQKQTSKIGRSFDLVKSQKEIDKMKKECEALQQQLNAMNLPCSSELLSEVNAHHRMGKIAVHENQLNCKKREAKNIVSPIPGWFCGSKSIRSPKDVEKVLLYISKFYPESLWRAALLKTNPRCCVPSFISNDQTLKVLQNIPNWQSAKICLLCCALTNTKNCDMRKWCRKLHINDKYIPLLQKIVCV